MRHAQRQDEVDDNWTAAEAARPGGRPWDPPLSSPHGLAEAEAAAEKLAAWECSTGARIVSVVTSPFLRCLQTASAACRRLGLQQLHLSWEFSEALCRVAGIPSGPLPTWMWPPPQGGATTGQGTQAQITGGSSISCAGSGSSRGLTHEDFLGQLGALVIAAPAGGGSAAPSVAVETAAVARAHQLPQQQEGRHIGSSGEAARPQRQLEKQKRGEGAGSSGDVDGMDGAAAATLRRAGKLLPEAPSSASSSRSGTAEGQVLQGLCVTVLPVRSLPGRTLAAAGGIAHVGPAEGPCRGAVAPDSEVEMERQSPETLEAAYERYRSALQCLMATAAAAGGDIADGGNAVGHGKGGGGGDLGALAAASLGNPEAALSSEAAVEERTCGVPGDLGPWSAVWQARPARRTLKDVVGTAAEADSNDDAGCRGDCAAAAAVQNGPTVTAVGSRAPGSGTPDEAAASTSSRPGGGEGTENGVTCCGEDHDSCPSLQRHPTPPVSTAQDTPPYVYNGMPGTAVLVVTHGDAVACAAATVAPWVLVYEVRHTGFVVLASGERCEDRGKLFCCGDHANVAAAEPGRTEPERPGSGSGPGGQDRLGRRSGGVHDAAAWELVPDIQGNQGVLWMSTLG
ncbi:hypothetical protein VOLCADRAFT_97074 [Volvox carteri f. nagariensis]|uniref:Uncharacterized protein n=1 Tax=Volvox carteri f. nagariensis TaxID=3068 RepID=D8UBU1_VOLCA|nr:uncharacterized protein VOLCADRAFT_97074 [Volvox carteri f. nagariensis]EFJ42882.1 hypothetical protein VOLCADRAFT_97074 [Volvox carteri f. nagariensis]|eukprot:XP_002956142.1 hypothetical protein VOLCADRAFT_97074 [Volvox carteri f. nagariensis]